MKSPMLEVKDLQVDFQKDGQRTTALHQVSFDLAPAEILAIVGESGSGKSVTALSILGLLPSPPARYPSGEILFRRPGQEGVTDLLRQGHESMRQIRGNEISMIFQEPMSSLNPVMTCGAQVMESMRQHQQISAPEARKRTIALFSQVELPNPAGMMHRYPHQLSGGQKQRVMIAMAICCNPALLICDEPTTALDVTVQKTILHLIGNLRQSRQMGVIFITHDLGVVAEIADRAMVMYQGRIVEQARIPALLTHPSHPYTQALLQCRPALHRRGERLPVASDFLPSDPRPEPTGKPVAIRPSLGGSRLAPNPAATTSTSPMLQVENLTVTYGATRRLFSRAGPVVRAVDDVSLDVYQGETLGLVGESGCGKTTLGRCLLRLQEPSSGRILLNGEDLLQYRGKALKAIRSEIQMVFQDPFAALNPRMTIGAALAEPMQVRGMLSSRADGKRRVAALLDKVHLSPALADRYPHEFSGGQRQRIVIARALGLHPSFVVFDESVSALDVSIQAQVLNLINDLKAEFGFTAIFISHDLSVIRYISDRIAVMNMGKIEEIGPAETVYRSPRSAYTRRLIDAIPKTVG